MKKIGVILLIFVTALLCVCLCSCSEAYSLSFAEESYTVNVNSSVTPKINVKPSNSDYKISVANNLLAVSDGKTITGVKTGITDITVTAGALSATAKLIITDGSTIPNDPITQAQQFYVNFYITNYQDVGLTQSLISTQTFEKNSIIYYDMPYYAGYISHGWYKNQTCTESYNGEPVTAAFNLYCFVEQRENGFMFNSEMYVIGLEYPNLPHENLVLPSEHNGTTINGIADDAFKNDTLLKTVTIPACYTKIGDSAFAGCTELTTVTIEKGSILESVGKYAFCLTAAQQEEDGEYVSNDNACAKLTSINLPNTVTEIGEFAFCYCSSLVLDDIPTGISVINYGAFSGTKINNVDFSNVTRINEYAFKDCLSLSSVSGTQNVTYCGLNAFYGSALYKTQYAAGGLIYADSILISCNQKFGYGYGNGKATLNENTTYIAPNALNNTYQSELSVYFPQNNVLIGENAFLTDKNGVCLVVPESQLTYYKEEYPSLANSFCTKYVIDVTDENAVNFGQHVLLKFSSTEYYYDKFITAKTSQDLFRSPTEIRLSLLNVGNYIKRINSHAFDFNEYGGNLEILELAGASELANMAISDCKKLTLIDISGCSGIVNLVDSNSVQFSSVGSNCVLCVKENDYERYRDAYNGLHATAKSRLSYLCNVKLVITNYAEIGLADDVFGTEKLLKDSSATQITTTPDGYNTTWYSDINCTVKAETITASTTLYGVATAK